MQQTFARLEEATSWSSAIVLCDCKSLVEAQKNTCTIDVGIRTIQSAAEDRGEKTRRLLSPEYPATATYGARISPMRKQKQDRWLNNLQQLQTPDICFGVLDVVTNCSPMR